MQDHTLEILQALCTCLTKPAVSDELAREVALHVRVLSREPAEVLAPSLLRLLLALDAWVRTTGGGAESEAVATLLGAVPVALGKPHVDAWLAASPSRAESERMLAALGFRFPELDWLARPPTPPLPSAVPPLELDTRRYDAFVAHAFDALAQQAGLSHDDYRRQLRERLEHELERHGSSEVSTVSSLLAWVCQELGRDGADDGALLRRLGREHAPDPHTELLLHQVARVRRLVERVTDPVTEVDRVELGDVEAELGDELLFTDLTETRTLLAAVVRTLDARSARLRPETWSVS